MISARNAASNPLQSGMLIVDVSELKLPGEAKQNNLPTECGQPIDRDDYAFFLGNPALKLTEYSIFFQVTMMATCLTLTAMTIDRYFAIVHPLKSMNKRTPRVAIITSCTIWIGKKQDTVLTKSSLC
jgi:hypothetical protein